MHHFILGGQRSGKSRFAERLGMKWLSEAASREVCVVATALPGDREMQDRIDRHRCDRPECFSTTEAPRDLGAMIRSLSAPHRLVLVDCLTLWVTNWLMPSDGPTDAAAWQSARLDFLEAFGACAGPVVCISNEIGWGVIPMGSEVRDFVDELGRLNQDVAQRCQCVTLMAAGQPWTQEVQRW
ncbi:MAG: bifunctional adenosylcobinamide kinase/adenosylcobinamide-phosphate guanylyltransferase [Burkholderiales bacterium]|nr:bifunctional adenosylcobinamide kinase/adenosylcobinamide-phosphate guanylyltransferase [Burkholderiales bacterium]